MSLEFEPWEGRRGDLPFLSDWLIYRGLVLMIKARIPGRLRDQPRVPGKNPLALESLITFHSSSSSLRQDGLCGTGRGGDGLCLYECSKEG